MRTFSLAALIALSALVGLTYAQGAIQRTETFVTQPTPISLEPLLQEHRTTCYLPDDSKHSLNTAITYDGQRYRCVEVFAPYPDAVRSGQSQTLKVQTAGWVKVP